MPTEHPVLRGIVIGILLAVLLGLVAGMLVQLTALPELSSTMGTAALSLVIFIGGLAAAYRAGSRGLLVGVQVALVFIMLLLAVTLIFYSGQFSWQVALIKVGASLLSGAIGGMLGVALRGR